MRGTLRFRQAEPQDVPGMVACRDEDQDAGPADARMALYLEEKHHPQYALEERTIIIAIADDGVAGYIGGHRTTRFDCDGELQYLYVAREYRRSGVASELLRQSVVWFRSKGMARICVDVTPDNRAARAFYVSHGAQPLNPSWMVWDQLPSPNAGTPQP